MHIDLPDYPNIISLGFPVVELLQTELTWYHIATVMYGSVQECVICHRDSYYVQNSLSLPFISPFLLSFRCSIITLKFIRLSIDYFDYFGLQCLL